MFGSPSCTRCPNLQCKSSVVCMTIPLFLHDLNILCHNIIRFIKYLRTNCGQIHHISYLDVYIAENRGEFLEKLQRARSQVKPNSVSQPVLSRPGTIRLIVGNWALSSRRESVLGIHNSDSLQVTILREDLPGFIFESNRGTKHSFTAETSLGE